MKSICLFSSYFNQNKIPFYIKFYLEELTNHFSEVILITNEKELLKKEKEYLISNNMQLKMVLNEGYDFGMWFKAMKELDIETYDRIAFINDSCILFKKLDSVFDWIDKSNLDYCGLIDSLQVSYHLQSFFIVLNKNAIPYVYEYFLQNGIKQNIKEVIMVYEIGLTSYLERNGIKAGALFSYRNHPFYINPSISKVEELIKKGMPIIKKKIIFNNFRRDETRALLAMNLELDPQHYVTLIKNSNKNEQLLDFELLKKIDGYKRNFIRIYLWKACSLILRVSNKTVTGFAWIVYWTLIKKRKWR